LYELWEEVNRNVERYCVIEQRQFISEFFDIEAWEEARAFSGIRFSREMEAYAVGVEAFNKLLKSAKDFEDKYSSSISHKTKINAEELHRRKENVDRAFEVLRPRIMTAQAEMRKLLKQKASAAS
jgi:hypothetical protein